MEGAVKCLEKKVARLNAKLGKKSENTAGASSSALRQRNRFATYQRASLRRPAKVSWFGDGHLVLQLLKSGALSFNVKYCPRTTKVLPSRPITGWPPNKHPSGRQLNALWQMDEEATIISEDQYSSPSYKTHITKLEPTQKPVLGANNMPLDVVGKTEETIELGKIGAQHKVLVCQGLAKQVLIGMDFLTAHKCIIDFNTNTVYSKGGPKRVAFGCVDRVYRITGAETVKLSPNMVANIPCERRSNPSSCTHVFNYLKSPL